MTTATERREALKLVWEQAKQCRACALHETRTTVVFGAGNADADLMFVGEAPGANEDKQGMPFVGAAGKLLDQLLAEIGIDRSDVFIANTLKCRPPDNRNPMPLELEACEKYLFSQLELIQPVVVCTLGNFATKLLRDDPTGISKLHGKEEVRQIGPRAVRLYPLYHPAAALYTRATLDLLREDFARIPGLLAKGSPAQPNVGDVAANNGLEEASGVPITVPSLRMEGSTVEGHETKSEAINDVSEATPADERRASVSAQDDDSSEQLGLF